MATNRVGIVVSGHDSLDVLEQIQQAETLGIPAAWLTTGGSGRDALTLFAAAFERTSHILLGTSITPILPRHPIAVAQQVQVLSQLGPARFRLGIGPSHKPSMEEMFGLKFNKPLLHLQEYLQILKALLQEGVVDFDGDCYQAHASIPTPTHVPVMASALREQGFRVCGAAADGAISWLCPLLHLRNIALPAIKKGADEAGRQPPPLIAHAPICVHDNPGEVRRAARQQLAHYPRLPFYAKMFADAGFPEALQGSWSDSMIDTVVLSGDEETVANRLKEFLSIGADELVLTLISAGQDQEGSRNRSLNLVAQIAKQLRSSDLT